MADEAQNKMPSIRIYSDGAITFTYINWRGQISKRRVMASSIQFSSSRWHPEPQWLLHAFDLDKNEPRYFAMKDMINVCYE